MTEYETMEKIIDYLDGKARRIESSMAEESTMLSSHYRQLSMELSVIQSVIDDITFGRWR